MRIAQVIPYLGRAQGGPVFGLAAYCAALVDAGCGVEVLGGSQTSEGDLVRLDSRVPVRSFDASGWGSFRGCPGLNHALSETNCDIIHSHGLWTDVHRSAAAQARARGLPHLLAPCGMLMPGALRRRWWKKVPVWLWFQGSALRQAQCIHAKSQKEYEDIRRFGLLNPIAIIPNPIALPPGREERGEGRSESEGNGRQRSEVRGQRSVAGGPVVRGPWSSGPSPGSPQSGSPLSSGQWSRSPSPRSPVVPFSRTVLFLGRLHPVKGLARLIQAWAKIQKPAARSPSSLQWQLVLAGPDEGGYRKELERLIGELGCGESVVFAGELNDAQKWEALAAADLFVMPSDFENFGNAIVEAMMSGLPVITTTGTPWKDLPALGVGWCVEPTVGALELALREALQMPEEARREMGRKALDYSAQFRPEKAASDLIQVYQWLLHQAPCPACVRLD